MKIISENQIKDLGITPSTYVNWAKESFSIKKKAQLPAKIVYIPKVMIFSRPCPVSYLKNSLGLGLR